MQGTSSAAEKAAVSMRPPPARSSSAILKATTVGSLEAEELQRQIQPTLGRGAVDIDDRVGRSSVRKSRVTSSSAE